MKFGVLDASNDQSKSISGTYQSRAYQSKTRPAAGMSLPAPLLKPIRPLLTCKSAIFPNISFVVRHKIAGFLQHVKTQHDDDKIGASLIIVTFTITAWRRSKLFVFVWWPQNGKLMASRCSVPRVEHYNPNTQQWLFCSNSVACLTCLCRGRCIGHSKME